MKCPFCSGEIKDDTAKCIHCGEWVESKNYIYPVDGGDSNSFLAFDIDGDDISVSHFLDGSIVLSQNGETLLSLSKEEAKRKNELQIGSHKLIVQYKKYPAPLDMLFFNAGFNIFVDGKPLEKTAADPNRRLKTASYCLLFYMAISIIRLFIVQDTIAKIIEAVLAGLFLFFFIIHRRTQILIFLLGLLFAVCDLYLYIVQSVNLGYTDSWFVIWMLLRGGFTLALGQGFLAGMKLSSLRRKMRSTNLIDM